MKFLLVLAGVLCVALIVSARPADEEADTEDSTDASEVDGTDSGTPVGDTEREDDTAAAEDDTATDEGTDDDGTEGIDGTEGPDGTKGDDGAQEEGDGTETEDAEEGEGGAEGDDGAEGGEGGEGGAKETARNTYRQVHKLLKKIMKVNMKDKYLKSYVLGRLQERLMNPTIDLVNTIEKYSKIKSCFNSLEKDVQGLVKESEKSYAECKKENSNGDCGNEGTRELDEGLIDRELELADCIVDKRDSE
uniref:Aegyptin/gSG7 salivary protein-like four-helix bundle domain-containing protein n=1 Tax=Anopheles atroparvus TaxID=41427 RepID=A0AAG5D6W4_ANOAO